MLKVKACAQHACTTRLAIAVDHGYAYIELEKKKDGHTCLCFGKFNTLDLLFFCSVPYVTVSVRIIARLACNLGKTR